MNDEPKIEETPKESRKACPLSFTLVDAGPGWSKRSTFCTESCAWYHASAGACAILVTAQASQGSQSVWP